MLITIIPGSNNHSFPCSKIHQLQVTATDNFQCQTLNSNTNIDKNDKQLCCNNDP